jgi:hypothetical protein
MTTDVVVQLLQMIETNFGPSGGTPPVKSFGQTDNNLSTAANYAQLLGTASGPIAQAAAITVVGGTDLATGAEQAAFLAASVETAGIAAAVILIVSFVLAETLGSDDSQSAQSQILQDLNNSVAALASASLANYWQSTLVSVGTVWKDLGANLDDLASQGTGGNYVKMSVANWHSNALGYCNLFIPSRNPAANVYWQRPFDPYDPIEVLFGPIYAGIGPGWYGPVPQPQGSPYVSDPRTTLPFLTLGIQSYLTLQMLANFVDPSQPRFDDFLQSYGGDLDNYASFIFSQYSLAVNGIRKTDLPSSSDIIGGLWMQITLRDGLFTDSLTGQAGDPHIVLDTDPSEAFPFWGGSQQNYDTSYEPLGIVEGQAGSAWIGTYGAAETYPAYGIYSPFAMTTVAGATAVSPSLVLSNVYSTEGQHHQLIVEFFQNNIIFRVQDAWLISSNVLVTWVVPWIQNRIVLGTMARWKAIYLRNGYDKVSSILQKLQSLSKANPAILPTVIVLDQDGTKASGDWSARELFAVLKGVAINDPTQGFAVYWSTTRAYGTGYSVFGLIQFLDTIATGSWSGPPSYTRPPYGPGRPRPLSFRDRLAAAAT